MHFNFDQNIERRDTASSKWDGAHILLGDKARGAIPMWVADMDFKAPPQVIAALKERVEHGIFGYAMPTESYYNSIISWMRKQHSWHINKEWIHYSPGVVPALNFIVQAFTQVGDCVAIQSPVYYPFTDCIINNARHVVVNQLCFNNNRYRMDYQDLEKQLTTNNVKIIILCNPHNPVGRVWSHEELEEFGNICCKHDVLVISDEIHADITYGSHKTTPFACMSDEFAQRTIVCTSPSKTFNLAGLQTSNIIIKSSELGSIFDEHMRKIHLSRPNIFGQIATEAAYTHGEEWLYQLNDYIKANLEFFICFIRDNIPKIKVVIPEGTYLVWLDCRELRMDNQELRSFMLEKARVAMDDGFLFGPGGEGFMRMNIACTRSTLQKAVEQILRAINNMS